MPEINREKERGVEGQSWVDEGERKRERGYRVVGGRKKVVGVGVLDPFMQPTYSAEGAGSGEQAARAWLAVGGCGLLNTTTLRLVQRQRATMCQSHYWLLARSSQTAVDEATWRSRKCLGRAIRLSSAIQIWYCARDAQRWLRLILIFL